MGARRTLAFLPLVGCWAIAAGLFPALPTVVAGASQAEPRSASFRLITQTPWVAPGGDAFFHLDIDTVEAPGNLEISATVHTGLTSRGRLSSILRNNRPGNVLASPTPAALDSLRIDADGNYLFTVSTQDPSLPRDAGRVSLRADGVYPVDIRLRNRSSGAQLDRQITYLPVVKASTTQVPLMVAVVWRLDASPVHGPNGEATAKKQSEVEARLGPVAQALADASSVPFTLAPVPETLDAWARRSVIASDPTGPSSSGDATPPDEESSSLQRLGAALSSPNRFLTMEPYAPIDLPSLNGAGLADEVDAQFDRGIAVTRDLFGKPDLTTLVTGMMDGRSVDQLVARGVNRVVVDAASVNLASQTLTPARPFTITGNSRARRLLAGVADRELGELLDRSAAGSDDTPGLRAAKFVAAATVTALELPAQQRGVIVVASPGSRDQGTTGNVGADLVDAVAIALRSNPLLTAQTLDSYFEGVPHETLRGKPAVRALRPLDPQRPNVAPSAVRSARARLRSFATLTGGESPLAERAERSLLLAESYKTGDSSGRYRAGGLEVVRKTIDQVEGPAHQTITLIGERAEIPVSFVNHTGQDLRVEVRLQSDKLLFPDGRRRMLTLAPRSTTAAFAVEARTRGTFPLFVTLTSPDGQIVVTQSELTIRSTAGSGVGPVLTIGAAAFLLGWWALHFRGIRRRRNLA